MNRTDLGRILREGMTKHGLTYSSLARKADVSVDTARLVVLGEVSTSTENATKLLEIVGYTLTPTPTETPA